MHADLFWTPSDVSEQVNVEYENLSFAIQYDAFVFSFSLGALWDNGGFFFNAFLGFGQKAVDGHGSSHF